MSTAGGASSAFFKAVGAGIVNNEGVALLCDNLLLWGSRAVREARIYAKILVVENSSKSNSQTFKGIRGWFGGGVGDFRAI